MRKWLGIFLSVVGLILVRAIGDRFFYDPLVSFFHNPGYQILPLPEIDFFNLIGSLVIRFSLNAGFIMLLAWSLFKKKEIIKFMCWVFGLSLIILLPTLLLFINIAEPENYGILFFIRRMIIHPIIGLVLIPALLYHDNQLNKKK